MIFLIALDSSRYASMSTPTDSPFNEEPIVASQICKGFVMWIQNDVMVDKVSRCIVTKVRMAEEKGMVNVFTLANNILVNNVLASCRIF